MNQKALELTKIIIGYYVNEQKSIPEISQILEIPPSTIRRILMRNGVNLRD